MSFDPMGYPQFEGQSAEIERLKAENVNLRSTIRDMLPWIDGNGIKSLDCTARLKIVLRAREATR